MSQSNKFRARFAAVTVLTLAAGLAGAAYASSDRDRDSGRQVDRSATAPGAGTASGQIAPEDVLARLRNAGYSDFREIEREKGRYEVKARNAGGDRVELYVDAHSGEIVKEERDD